MWPCGHGSTQSAAPCTGQFGSQTKSGPVCGGQVQSCAMASGLPGLGSIRRSLLIRFTLAFSRLTYCRRSSPAGHSISGTTASIEQSRLSIPAATAGEIRRVLWMRSYIQTEAPRGARGALTGWRAIPIVSRFPARCRLGRYGRTAAARGVAMMRNPGTISRPWVAVRGIVPRAERRRR